MLIKEQHVISCLCILKYTEHLDAYKLFLEIYENVAICAAYAFKRLETMYEYIQPFFPGTTKQKNSVD